MKKIHKYTLAALGAATLVVGAWASSAGGDLPSAAELDAQAQQMVEKSFHDKGIVKVSEVFAEDATLAACMAADVAGTPIDPEIARQVEAMNMAAIQWPEEGNYLGDWREGEKIAQSGRGRTWTDKADTVNGGNCYNCHQISSEELSFGTIGPSLYNYGKLRGVTDPASDQTQAVVKYTWGKIWNSQAYSACSNMPRAGHNGVLTADQVRHIMALLLDPASPVNE